jgi:hypothetical protein
MSQINVAFARFRWLTMRSLFSINHLSLFPLCGGDSVFHLFRRSHGRLINWLRELLIDDLSQRSVIERAA